MTHLANLAGGELLGPGRSLPLLRDTRLLESLLDGTRTGGAGELGEGVGGEDEVAVGEGLAGDRGGGALNESAVVVDDLDDHGELAGRGAVVDKNDTADLDETLEGGGLLRLERTLDSWTSTRNGKHKGFGSGFRHGFEEDDDACFGRARRRDDRGERDGSNTTSSPARSPSSPSTAPPSPPHPATILLLAILPPRPPVVGLSRQTQPSSRLCPFLRTSSSSCAPSPVSSRVVPMPLPVMLLTMATTSCFWIDG